MEDIGSFAQEEGGNSSTGTEKHSGLEFTGPGMCRGEEGTRDRKQGGMGGDDVPMD